MEERKKYCLDFNKGVCKFHRLTPKEYCRDKQCSKLHVCKKCLVQDNVEMKHPEKRVHEE